ncbi:MAG: hypothetical protein KGV57_00995 [Fusobacterium sp.]|nr:hypothetical protein [Fusobacterium sp.]
MLFYEDLLKKLEGSSLEKSSLKKIEKFGLSSMRKLTSYGIVIPLILIGLFQVYYFTQSHKWYFLIIGIIFFGIGLKQLKNILIYGIKIDTEIGRIKSGKLDILTKDIEEATLKETKVGKKVLPVLSIITNEKRQFIIILLMANQVRFLNIIKILVGDKFKIEK